MKPLNLLPRLEYGFTVLALFLYSSTIMELVLSGGGVQQNQTVDFDSSLSLLAFMVTYVVFGTLLLLRWRSVLRSLRGEMAILPLLAVACLSYFWSDAPDVTLRRLVALVGTSLVGIYLASRYSPRQQLHLLGWVFGLVVVGSYLFGVALPSYGVMTGLHEGAWRGIFMHKNGLGMKMALSAIVFFLLALGERRRRWLYGLGFGASVGLLLLSQSGTGIVTLAVTLLALPLYRVLTLRGGFNLTWGLLAAVTAVSVPLGYLWLNLTGLLDLLGKDMTLTGRSEIWPIVLRAIAERPLLGYGYEAFWGGLGSPAAVFQYVGLLGATHAHNGLLQLWLALGFVGVVVFVCGLWVNLLRAMAYLRHDTTAESYWPMALITVLVLINVTESNILEYNDITWVLYCSLSVTLAHWFADFRQLAPAGLWLREQR